MKCGPPPARIIGGTSANARTPPCEDSGDDKNDKHDEVGRWRYNKTLKMIIHFPLCPVCMHWYAHYTKEAAEDDRSLRTANETRDRAHLDGCPWPAGTEGLEKERDQAVQELTEMRKQLSEARRELKKVRQHRADQVDSHNKKRQLIEANFNPTILKLRRDIEEARQCPPLDPSPA